MMPMFGKQMLVVLAIALTAVGATIFGSMGRDEVVRLDEGTPVSTELNVEREERSERASEKIYVYVTGAVNNPGMVELNGSELRAGDAVNASGGLLPTADVDAFNMAEKISDGQHIRVPEKRSTGSTAPTVGSTVGATGGSSEAVTSDGVVNINTAGIKELDTLPGIGEAMAQRIIDYRELNGGFKSIEEIQNVRGIGEKKFEKLKDRIKI